MPDLEINIGWTSNAQSLDTSIRDVQKATAGFARMIVNDVALAAAELAYQNNRTALVSNVRKVAMAEVSRMAMLIANTIAVPDNRQGPEGPMSLRGGMSVTAERLGMQQTYYREDAGIRWPKRSKKYLAWKQQRGRPGKWWDFDSDLRDSLSEESLYLNAFGPVNVIFTRAKNQQAAKSRMDRSLFNSAGGESSSTSVQKSLTASGRAGRVSAEFQVGRLEVVAFGKITPKMLPSLNNMKSNDAVMGQSKPQGNIEGLAGLLPEGDTRMKLVGRQEKRRYTLEPFVSYYLTRAIPNAVWRRTEQLVGQSGSY